MALLVVTATLIGSFWREPDLLTRSTRYAPFPLDELDCYAWLSYRSVLVNHRRDVAGQPSNWTYYRWDLNGVSTPIDALSTAFRTKPHLTIWHDPFVSPSGDWVVAQVQNMKGPNAEGLVVAQQDGSAFHIIKLNSIESPRAWSPDGNSVTCLDRATSGTGLEAVSYPLDGRPPVRRSLNIAHSVATPWADMRALSVDRLRLASEHWAKALGPLNETEVYDIRIAGQVSVLAHHTVRLPDGLEIWQTALSPDGGHIAILAHRVGERSPMMSLLHRIGHVFSAPANHIHSIWISSADGKVVREIGSLATHSRNDGPGKLAWRPDGRQLSYLYKQALWTVDPQDY